MTNNAMEMLERYLQAVGQYLPQETKDDTLAELRANLLEQMEAREEELGRPLEEGDAAAMVRAHGKPEVVALRYLPQRSLIGPTVFPFYKFTLVRVMPLVVLVSFIARAIEFASATRESAAQALGSFALGLCSSLLISGAIVTAVFAGIEWGSQRGKLGGKWNEWDPAKLPALRKQEESETPKSMAMKALALVMHCLWFAYVVWVPWHQFWMLGPGVFYLGSLNVSLAPVWHGFYALLIVLLTIQLAMRLLAFVPAAKLLMTPMKLGTDVLGLVAVGWLACARVYFVASGAGAAGHDVARVNEAVGVALRIAFVAVLAGVAQELWKRRRRTKAVRQMAF